MSLDGDAIVDAVAGHANDVTLGLQGVHDADLMLGTGPVGSGAAGFYIGNGVSPPNLRRIHQMSYKHRKLAH